MIGHAMVRVAEKIFFAEERLRPWRSTFLPVDSKLATPTPFSSMAIQHRGFTSIAIESLRQYAFRQAYGIDC